MKTIHSLSPGFLSAYYRNQTEEVKTNVRLALGACVNVKLNLSKVQETDKPPIP